MPDPTPEEFQAAFKLEDELGLVVRAHIHIEFRLECFLMLKLPHYANYSRELSLDYDKKLLLACAVGLPSELKSPLSAFGKLRNRFAHRPNYSLGENDVNSLYDTLSTKHKQLLNTAYANVTQGARPPLSRIAPRDRLGVIAVLLYSRLTKVRQK